LYLVQPGDTTKVLKIKRNNPNRYACRRINNLFGI